MKNVVFCHSGESRNPALQRKTKTWMPDQVRHDDFWGVFHRELIKGQMANDKRRNSFFLFVICPLPFVITAFLWAKPPDHLALVEAKVVSVMPESSAKGWLVILAPKSFDLTRAKPRRAKSAGIHKVLVIGVGEAEGMAILLAIGKKASPRPLTHELFTKMLGQTGSRLSSCLLHSVSNNTFFARLDWNQNGKKLTTDARPSDAIALTLRAGGKVYVLRKVFDEAGVE